MTEGDDTHSGPGTPSEREPSEADADANTDLYAFAPDAIPDALTDRPQWVCWITEERDGKPTKVPVDPRTGRFASTTDGTTWTTFDEALAYATEHPAGIGFVFTEDDPFVGIDLDDCRDPKTGDSSSDARDIITRLDSYTETSPSGTGYHIIVEGDLPDGANRRGFIECYAHSRYFTVTGNREPNTPPTIEHRTAALQAVHTEYVHPPSEDSPVQGSDHADTSTRSIPPSTAGDGRAQSAVDALSDQELIERAHNARNGHRFERLWKGSIDGYASHSEADMALCCMLAFWTANDPHRMDRLFRESGLMRTKWDTPHYANGTTYGQGTIDRAISITTDVYQPPTEDSAAPDGRYSFPIEELPRSRSERESKYLDMIETLNEALGEADDEITRLEARIEELEAERDEPEEPARMRRFGWLRRKDDSG